MQAGEGHFFHYELLPTSRTTTPYTQNKSEVKGAIPGATAFFAGTHGNPGQFASSEGLITYNLNNWLDEPTRGDISSKVAEKTSSQPPYNFVLMMACSTGATTAVANAFGITNMSIDRAYLGWSVIIVDLQSTADWTGRLMTRLREGDTLNEAINFANDPDDNPMTDDRVQVVGGGGTVPIVIGDGLFKLTELYDFAPDEWHD